MKHITIIDLENEYKQLIPDEGYLLKKYNNTYSEAVVKSIKGWEVIKK